ncbi:MAG: SsrA-binding protein SmpB [Puniceicoccales bacterium]|jgi:SsrA-binding protein|nr:SsrA-binding protein SmpB [Puniceicoccales bacterium]
MAKQNNAIEIKHRKVFHDYVVGDTFDAGIILQGTEVKSVKLGHAQINEAFVRIGGKGLPLLFNAQIDEYAFGNFANHDAKRQRSLLLHRREIKKIRDAIEREGFSAIPIKMYVVHGLVKLKFALCKGKKLYDKRHDLRQRSEMREAERFIAQRHRQGSR